MSLIRRNVLEEAKQFRDVVAQLKVNSKPYPEIISLTIETYHENKPKYNIPLPSKITVVSTEVFYSTLVRVQREGKWYLVHLVKSLILTPNYTKEMCLMELVREAYKIQYLYKLNGPGFEDVDPNQDEEVIRLIDYYKLI